MPYDRHVAFIDFDIASLLTVYPEFASSYCCLITCLDSSSDVVGAFSSSYKHVNFESFGTFVLISGEDLVAHRNVFNGFDEVYYFEKTVWAQKLSTLKSTLWCEHFTSDNVDVTKNIPSTLSNILIKSEAIRFTSDGCGLNLICESYDVLTKVNLSVAEANVASKKRAT